MFEIHDFSSWQVYSGASEGSGRSEKEWLISKVGEMGLFKYPKSEFTTEHVSEHLAHQLGELLSVRTANIDLGIRNGRMGSISYRINTEMQALIEGVQFISGKFPKFNADTMVDENTGRFYCLSMIEEAAGQFFSSEALIEMLVFDYLIGNKDRHQSNWGIIAEIADREKGTLRVSLSPLYDNGSSLCCYTTDDQIKAMSGNDPGPFRDLVDSKSRSIIRIDGSMKRQPTHKEMVRFLLQNYDCTNSIAMRFISRLSEKVIADLIIQYPDYVLSPARKELIRRFLNAKVAMLQELVNEAGVKT